LNISEIYKKNLIIERKIYLKNLDTQNYSFKEKKEGERKREGG